MQPPQEANMTERREKIMDELTELYSCRPTKAIFQRAWHPDAVFEDPLVKAQGWTQYEAQWFAMPWLFSRSRPISRRVILSTETPNRLVYRQVQEYTLRFLGRTQRIESVIDLELDESDRITRMADKWNGEELPTYYGAEWLRWLNARVTPWLVKVPKEGTLPETRSKNE
ncbi:hypothetical protein L210DRAFT_3527731 [Boletus edulis BED1]|uniref:Uncharacterized protein n=1 Tax=Boletus edulis BED1 TaxID=1328754 RepID=A0AAD4C4D0_BOLED|nr:hypothetical protein L210DRAFT_3527731 [Boletus edulis BED1]